MYWHDVQGKCGSTVFQEIAAIADDDNTEDGGAMVTEDMDIQVGDIEPLFELTMSICPIKYKREFELDLWANRPDTSDDVINRAILIRERDTPLVHSLL